MKRWSFIHLPSNYFLVCSLLLLQLKSFILLGTVNSSYPYSDIVSIYLLFFLMGTILLMETKSIRFFHSTFLLLKMDLFAMHSDYGSPTLNASHILPTSPPSESTPFLFLVRKQIGTSGVVIK